MSSTLLASVSDLWTGLLVLEAALVFALYYVLADLLAMLRRQ